MHSHIGIRTDKMPYLKSVYSYILKNPYYTTEIDLVGTYDVA